MKIKLLIIFMFVSVGVSAQIQYLGAPNVTVINRGNFKIDSILYLPKRIKAPTDSGALRYQISDSTLYLWTGSQWIKAKNDGTITSVSAGTGMSFPTITVNGVINADTTILSTRAWRKKGDDSLQANISLKVNISDTASMLTNYIRHAGNGLTKTGQALSVDTSAIATRARVQKGIDSLGAVKQNVITNPVTGTGTNNYVSKWTGTSTQAISQIFDNGTNVGIGTTTLLDKLTINGALTLSPTDSNKAYVRLQANSANLFLIGTDAAISGTKASDVGLFVYGNNNMDFWTNSGRHMRLTGGGLFGVNNLSPTYRLDVGGTFRNSQDAYFSTSSGSVGIGNTSPSYKLDISGTLRNTTGAAFATSSGNVLVGTTTDVGYKMDVAGSLRSVNSANFATTSGVLAVGKTATSGYKFQTAITDNGKYNPGSVLASSANVLIENLSTTDTTGSNIAFSASGSGGSPGITTISGIVEGNGKGVLTFGTRNTAVLSTVIERMRIDANGLIGMGTTAPTQVLDVNGRTRIRTIDSTATGMNMLYADATGVIKKAAVPSGGGGTVTSVATGYGLLGGTITTTGTLIVDTAAIATRSRVQKGIDSVASVRVGGTGTTNYVPKWSGTSTQTISQIFDNGTNVGIGTTSPGFYLDVAAAAANQRLTSTTGTNRVYTQYANTGGGLNIGLDNSAGTGLFSSGAYAAGMMYFANYPLVLGTNSLTRQIIHANGRIGINTTTDVGYQLDIAGTLRNTTGAAFATSSGNVLVGTTTDAGYKLDVSGTLRNTTGANFATSSGGVRIGDATTSQTRLDVIGGSFTSTSGMSHTGTNGGINISNIGTLAGNRDVQLRLVNGSTFFGASDASYQFINIGRSVTDAALDIQHYSKSTYTRRFRIDTTGNIAIGDIVTPTERLDVNGRARVRTIDSTGTAMNILYADATGVIKKAAVPTQIQTTEAVITGDYTVSLTDYFVSLPDLTTASRNVILPNTAVNGRQLIIFNTSSDGTFKWIFTNEDVEDASGAAITTLTDQKSYTMVYYNGKFRVTAIN